MSLDLDLRLLMFRVAVLENITREPIRIGAFRVRKNSASPLRPHDEDQRALSRVSAEDEVLFPQEMLLPSEKILIPVEMLMVWPGDLAKESAVTAENLNPLRTILPSIKAIRLPYLVGPSLEERQFTLSGTELLAMIERTV